MKRDMSYALDGAFSTRNQGQLMSVAKVQTRALRTPGLVPTGNRDTQRPVRGVGMGAAKRGGGGMGRRSAQVNAGGMAGMDGFNLELPLIGQVNWRSLALGGVLTLVVWKLTAERRATVTQRVARALAT